MSRLKLVSPSEEYKEQVLAYKREFIENKDNMAGSGGLMDAETFEEWQKSCLDNLSEETVREGLVPATTLLAIDEENNLVGMVDIRHRLNGFLLNYGGHIGYSVRTNERKKGYATEILELALGECNKLVIKEVLITCNKKNIASAKTIMKNSGKLENEIPQGEEVTQRYWIKL